MLYRIAWEIPQKRPFNEISTFLAFDVRAVMCRSRAVEHYRKERNMEVSCFKDVLRVVPYHPKQLYESNLLEIFAEFRWA